MFTAYVGLLLLQRGIELVISHRNQKWLRRRGAVEYGRRHYPAIVGLHALFYASLVLERSFLARSWDPLWPFWLALLIFLQLVRVWLMAVLGRFWNTRILVIPGQQPVSKGPYRFVRHPNYAVVALEILAVAMTCGAYITAVAFSLLNALVLRVRIREEEAALRLSGVAELERLPRFIPDVTGGAK